MRGTCYSFAPPAVKEVKPEAPTKQPASPSITKILKEQGYEGCDFLTQPRGRPKVLFVCGRKVNNTLSPSFFHYDTSILKTNREAQIEASHIIGITYNSPSSITMKFEKSSRTVPLQYPPYWLRKWQGRGGVNPDKDCSLDRVGSTYTLKCGDTSGQKVGMQERINI